MRKVSRSVLCTLLATALVGGCDGPFSLTLNHVNEKGPQRNAVIAISDPQIYTRERLLNDRDDEVKFLRGQLKGVNDQDYTPRLKRDLDTLLEVVGALSVKFDPVAAASIVDQAKVVGLQNQAQIEELKNLLDKIDQKQLSAKDPGETGNAAATAGPSTTPLQPIDTTALVTDMHKFLDALHTLVAARNDDATTKRPELRDNKVTGATPSEIFRDKMAYRNEIVAALQQAQLDDRHDLNGNALYRLQIKATVFPGKTKDKYAVARLTLLPPRFDDSGEVSRLYLDWLAYVAQRVNPPQETLGGVATGRALDGDLEIAERYSMLGPATGTYRITYLPYKSATPTAGPDPCSADNYFDSFLDAGLATVDTTGLDPAADMKLVKKVQTECTFLRVPTPPDFGETDVAVVASPEYSAAVANFLNTAAASIQAKALRLKDKATRKCMVLGVDGADYDLAPSGQIVTKIVKSIKAFKTAPKSPIDDESLVAAVALARNLYNLAPSYFLAIDRTRQNLAPSGGATAALQTYSETLGTVKFAANELLAGLASRLSETPAPPMNGTAAQEAACSTFKDVAGRIWVPDAFYDSVTDRDHRIDPTEGDSNGKPSGSSPVFFAGSAFAYSTAPTELAQRVSTVASATEAMDLIASVSALIPNAGVGINAAGEMRQVASGHVDAIESVPLIVGFSNSGAANAATGQYQAKQTEPSFGWVFGPKVTVDTEENALRLSQTLVQQPVTADVSVPGWWTQMRLRVETAWAANFDTALLQPGAPDLEALPESDAVTAYVMDVPLQNNPESFEQLTQFVANRSWGLQQRQPVITDVEPPALPACSEQTFLISGPDLWRGRAVYINGVAAETDIMPDMGGLSARFDLSRVQPGVANLVVWTQLGKVEYPVTINPPAGCGHETGSGSGMAARLAEDNAVFPDAVLKIALPAATPPVSYRVVVTRADGIGEPVRIPSGPGVVQTSETEFTVTMPNKSETGKAFGALPFDGTLVNLELRQDKQDDPKLVASTRGLVFYQDTVSSTLTAWANKKGNAVARKDPNTPAYKVVVPMPPKFALAFPRGVTADVSGFEDAAGKDAPISDVQVQIDDDTATIVFPTVNLRVKAAAKDTLTIALKAGVRALGSIPVPIK